MLSKIFPFVEFFYVYNTKLCCIFLLEPFFNIIGTFETFNVTILNSNQYIFIIST